jgi:hypothetical protein
MLSLSYRTRSRRRGLAPLELVLWLPVFMMVLALMVVFGNAAVWKLRTSFAARDAVWRIRTPRTGQNDPVPANFRPVTANITAGADGNIAVLDDARIDQPVVRGPLPPIEVRRDLLDPSKGKIFGRAEMTQHYPMLGRMGSYDFDVRNTLLDGMFRYWEMDIPANIYRRIPFIYILPQAPNQLAQAYVTAIRAIINAPFRRDLDVLDRDEEIRAYYGSYVDFHPVLQSFCEVDPQTVYDQYVVDVIRRIQGKQDNPSVPSVAETMANFFANMYQQMINDLQNQLQNAPPGQQGAIQQQISQLQGLMQQYRAFAQLARTRRESMP